MKVRNIDDARLAVEYAKTAQVLNTSVDIEELIEAAELAIDEADEAKEGAERTEKRCNDLKFNRLRSDVDRAIHELQSGKRPLRETITKTHNILVQALDNCEE